MPNFFTEEIHSSLHKIEFKKWSNTEQQISSINLSEANVQNAKCEKCVKNFLLDTYYPKLKKISLVF